LLLKITTGEVLERVENVGYQYDFVGLNEIAVQIDVTGKIAPQ